MKQHGKNTRGDIYSSHEESGGTHGYVEDVQYAHYLLLLQLLVYSY